MWKYRSELSTKSKGGRDIRMTLVMDFNTHTMRELNPDAKTEPTWFYKGRFLSIRCTRCMNVVDIDPGTNHCPNDQTPIVPLSWKRFAIPIGEKN